MKHNTSQYRLVSIGIVADNKLDDTKFIEVFPNEILPMHEGLVTSEIDVISVKSKDIDGVESTVQVNRSATLRAGWVGSTNRRTSPNVMKGEQVLLYTIGDTEDYFWDSMGRDDRLRRGETITWSWDASGITEADDHDVDSTNSYTFTIDTVTGHITLNTTAVNGETTEYICQVNTLDGNITIGDILGNTIQLDSVNSKLTLVNADTTIVTLDKKDIRMSAPDNITATTANILLEASKQITLKCPKILLDGEVTTTASATVAKTVKSKDISTGPITAKSLKASGAIKSASITSDVGRFLTHGGHIVGSA